MSERTDTIKFFLYRENEGGEKVLDRTVIVLFFMTFLSIASTFLSMLGSGYWQWLSNGLLALLVLTALAHMNISISRMSEEPSEILKEAGEMYTENQIRSTHEQNGGKYELTDKQIFQLVGIDPSEPRIDIDELQHDIGSRTCRIKLNVDVMEKKGVIIPNIKQTTETDYISFDIDLIDVLFDGDEQVVDLADSSFNDKIEIVTTKQFVDSAHYFYDNFNDFDLESSDCPISFRSLAIREYCIENSTKPKPMIECQREMTGNSGVDKYVPSFDYWIVIDDMEINNLKTKFYNSSFFNRVNIMASEENIDMDEIMK